MTAQPTIGRPFEPPRRQVPSHGPEAEALLDEVRASIATLAGLLAFERDLGEDAAIFIRGTVDTVQTRLNHREVRVAIVGEPGCGKSTLIDGLIGERLLGATTTAPGLVITVRRATERAYRARMKTGDVEEFATRVPDPIPRMREELVAIEAACAEAKRRSDETTIELAAASDALEGAEVEVDAVARVFEAAREEATRARDALERSGRLVADLGEATRERAASLPNLLLRQLPWWAVWWWIARLVLLAFTTRSFRVYRKLVRDSQQAELDDAARRSEMSGAAERLARAEKELETVNLPAERARKVLAATRRIRDGVDGRRQQLEGDAERCRQQLDRARQERSERFASEVRALTDPGARGKEVTELDIDFPARFLPEDVVIIDPAGAAANEADLWSRAWRAIREQADGCIVVSELEHPVGKNAKRFLEPLRETVPHAILVLTKMDRSFAWAEKQGLPDPREEVERARKIGTRRFARELGRDPRSVLSVAVAAEQSLYDGGPSIPAGRRFAAEIDTVFKLLRQERAFILGARSAGIVRRCIRDASVAESRAESTYRARIAALEAERIPDPDRFRVLQMQAAGEALDAAAKRVVEAAERVLRDNAALVRVECSQLVGGSSTRDELAALSPRLAETIMRGVESCRRAVLAEIDAQAEAALRRLESAVFVALRQRYELLHEADPRSGAPLHVDAELGLAPPAVDLAPGMGEAVRSFHRLRVGFGVGGAAAGAIAGSFVLPGLGTAAGAMAGGLLTLARTLGTLKRDAVHVTDGVVSELERELILQIGAAEPAVAVALRDGLDAFLRTATARFGRYIAEPLAAQRQIIDAERAELHALEELRQRLAQHESRLAWLIDAACTASAGAPA